MNHKEICRAVRRIAWGYVLVHLNFNLGTLDILPDWGGYILFLLALPVLGSPVPSALLLKPLNIIMLVWTLLSGIFALFGGFSLGTFPELLISIISLYFHFQFLTNVAELSEKNGCPQTQSILNIRIVRTIFTTLFILPLPWQEYEVFTWIVLLLQIILIIWLLSVLFSFHKSLATIAPETDADETEHLE